MFNCLSIAFTYFPISYCYNFLNKLLFNFSQSAILLQIYLHLGVIDSYIKTKNPEYLVFKPKM